MTESVLLAIAAVAEAASEASKFFQTTQGQALVEQSLKDRAAWDRAVRELGGWIEKLVTGKLS